MREAEEADMTTPAARSARLLELGVVLFAALLAAWMLVRSFPVSDELWRDVLHDRNGHYSFGLKLALSLRDLDFMNFFEELEKAKVWPPVHGLVLSVVLLLFGFDHRLGIVPSLLGWVLTVAFSWKIAMRSFEDAGSGIVMGLVAVALIATSPALALLSTDVMLEGLGSGLSAACLWAFIAACDEPEKAWRWRFLAIALTVLFFEKYNYWAIAVASIALTAFLIEPRVRSLSWVALRTAAPAAMELLRRPLFVAGIVVLIAAVAINMRGPTAIELFGNTVSLYPPRNIMTIAYALMFVAALQVWRAHRGAIAAFIGLPGSMLLAWHVLPLAISFLLPGRLATFVWFLGPANTGAAPRFDPLAGVALYRQAVESFFSLPAIAWCCLLLFVVAVVFMSKIRVAARVIFVFVAVTALVVLIHPQHQPRFVSTSMFALFCGAGAGLAILMQMLVPRNLPARIALGAVVALAVFAAQFSLPYPAMAYTTAIRARSGASNLDMIRLYAPFVERGQDLAIGATFGGSPLLQWPLMEDCKCIFEADQPWIGPNDSRAQVAAIATDWLENTPARQAVILDMPGYSGYLFRHENTVGLVDAISMQTRFRLVREIESTDPAGRILILERP